MATYKYNDITFTQDQIDQKAFDLNVSVEDYLSNQGSEIQVVDTTIDPISTIEDRVEIEEPITIDEEKPDPPKKKKKKKENIFSKTLKKIAERKAAEEVVKADYSSDSSEETVQKLLNPLTKAKNARKQRKAIEAQQQAWKGELTDESETERFVVRTSKDGTITKFNLDLWETFFDHNHDNFNEEMVNATKAALNRENPTVKDYLDYLNSNKKGTGGDSFAIQFKDDYITNIGFSGTEQEQVSTLEEYVIDASLEEERKKQAKEDIINSSSFDGYFDKLFQPEMFRQTEESAEPILKMLLPLQLDGTSFKIEQTGNDTDNDAIEITASNGESVVFNVGRDLDGSDVTYEGEIAKLKEFIGIHGDINIEKWRRATKGVSDFYKTLEEDTKLTPIQQSEVDNFKNKSIGVQIVDENGVKVKGEPLVITKVNSTITPGVVNVTGGENWNEEDGLFATHEETFLIQKEKMFSVDAGGEKEVITYYKEGSDEYNKINQNDSGGEIGYTSGSKTYSTITLTVANNPDAGEALNNARTQLTEMYKLQGLGVPSERVIREQAKAQMLQKAMEGMYSNNIENRINEETGYWINAEKELQASGIAGSALQSAETAVILAEVESKKSLAEVTFNKAKKELLLNNNNTLVSNFLNNEEPNSITGFPILARASDNILEEDGYARIDGKIYKVSKGESLPFYDKNGNEIVTMPESFIDGYNTAWANVQNLGNQYSQAYHAYSEVLLEDIDSIEDKVKIWEKNYNDWQEFGVTLGIAGISTAKNIVYGVGQVASYLNPMYWAQYGMTGKDPLSGVMAVNAQLTKWLEDEKNGYNFDKVSFSDIGGAGQSWQQSLENFAGWGIQMGAETLPIVAAMIFSGGSATYGQVISSVIAGASSAGGKFSDMDVQNYEINLSIAEIEARSDIDQDEKRNLISALEKERVGKAEYIAKGSMYGIIEGGFAYLTTSAQISDGFAVFRGDKMVATELYDGVGGYLKKKVPEWLKGANSEGLGEVGVTWGSNLVDGRPMTEGTVESYIGGFALGGVFEGIPMSYALMNSNFVEQSELKSIQETTKDLNKLYSEADKIKQEINLINMSDGGSVIKFEALSDLNSKLDDVNSSIDEQAGLLMSKQVDVENRLKDDGIRKKAGELFSENQTRMAELRIEVEELVNTNPNPDEATLDIIKNKNSEYKQLQNFQNKFKDKSLFGHKWFAMKGNGIFKSKNAIEVKKIEQQAIQNIQSDKTPGYKPTQNEINAEAVKILDAQDYDVNLDKANNLEGKTWEVNSFKNNKEARNSIPEIIAAQLANLEADGVDINSEIEYNGEIMSYKEMIEAQISETLQGIEDGSLNGYYDNLNKIQYTFKENAVKNQKPGVPLHEGAHGASTELIKKDPKAFDAAGSALTSFLQTTYPDLFLKMQAEGTNALLNPDGTWDFEEVFSSFVEEVAAGNIDPKTHQAFTAYLGKTLNDGFLDSSDGKYRVDFKGVNDISEYLMGMGRDIGKGKLQKNYLDGLPKTTPVIDLNADKETKAPERKIAASKSSASTSKADLISENKKLLKDKPKGFMDRIKANAAKIKAMISGSASAPTSSMDGGKTSEPTTNIAKKAKQRINDAIDAVRNKIPAWKEGNRRKPNAVMDKLHNDLGPELDAMIKAKAERFLTNDKNVIDLTQFVDLKELQQAVKLELLADFRGFNKTNDSLYGYINGRLKQRIGDVLPELWTDMSQKDIDNLSTTDTKTINETKPLIESVPDVNLRESLDIDRDSPLGDYVMETVEKVLSTKMPEFKYTRKNKGGKRTEVSLSEVKEVLKTNPTGPVKRQAERDLAGIYKQFTSDLEGRFAEELRDAFVETFGSRADYTDWLDINAEAISDLSIDKLVAFERLVKGEKIFTEVVKENLSVEEVKQFEGTGLLVSATTNQGPTLYKKLNPSKQQVIDFFDIKGSKKGTRKDSLADKIAGELALNATMEVAGKPEVLEKFELGLDNSGTGEVVVDAYLDDVSKAIGRGAQLKFSQEFMNSDAPQSLKFVYKNNNKKFVDRLKALGISTSSVDRAWEETFGDTEFGKTAEGKKQAGKIKKQWRGISQQIASVESILENEVQMEILNSIIDEEVDVTDTERAELIAKAKKQMLTGSKTSNLDFDDVLKNLAKNLGLTDGYAYEQLVYDSTKRAIENYNKNNNTESALKITGFRGEAGDKADFIATVGGMEFNIELKLNKPRFGSVTIKTNTNANGRIDFDILKDFSFNDKMYEMTDRARPAIEEYVDEANYLGKELYGDKWVKYEFGDQLDKVVFELLKGIPGSPDTQLQAKITTSEETSAQLIADYYSYKNNGTRQMNIQGVGLYLLWDNKNPELNNPANLNENDVPYLGHNGETVTWTLALAKTTAESAKGPTKYQDAGIELVDGKLPGSPGWANVGIRIQPSNLKTTVEPKYDISTKDGSTKLINDPAITALDTQKGESAEVNITNNADSKVVVKTPRSQSTNKESIRQAQILDRALDVARDPNAPVKKIRVFDFDDTLARTKSNVLYTMPDGTTGKLTAEEFAKKGDEMLAEGAVWDFSEFNKVMDGKKGPLFEVAKKIQEARGTDDVFVLTARSQEAAPAIKQFLDSVGLEIPAENISGLGDSSPLAKSGWMVDKAAEGYNDFYFADDHLGNVDAVDLVMSVIDVKSKTQQAKLKFSKDVGDIMNDIIYDKTGIESYKEYSSMRAKAKGRTKSSWSLIPPSAQDFGGLLYKLLGKGEKGDAQWTWMQDNLIKPFSRAMNDLSVAQNQLMSDFRDLKNSLKGIPKNLKKKAFGGFTYEDITRIAAWDRQGTKIDGLSDRDLKQIKEFVDGNPEINLFVDQLIELSKGDGYHYPGGDWLGGTITTDFIQGLRKGTRPRLLKQWKANVDLAFDEKTMNKLEAAFGPKYVEALKDSLRRMETGQNRKQGTSRLEARFQDYINNSVGVVMFLNTRSAILQTISAANFVNWSDNNPVKAGKAFANQKQYWSDFMELMNSEYLIDRRNGLKINVSESEIAEAAKTTGNSVKGVISLLLSKGFVLTQFADSFAIATGGATLYRNRVNTYIKQGKSKAEAEKLAFLDFRDLAEESQQSARADKISQQQASTLGRIVLSFANTPSQYARLMDKAGRDLINGRGDPKHNISKIMYYGFVQNLMFTALQSAMFAGGFNEDEEDVSIEYFKAQGMSDKEAAEAMKYYNSKDAKKDIDTANSMLDNILRGIGIQGVILATAKNTILDLYRRSQREGEYPGPQYDENAWKLLEVSPPISIKAKKYKGGMKDYEMNSWRPEAKEPFNINNPSYRAMAKVVAAVTNVPLDRLFQKMENIQGALDDTNETWQRVAMLLGWPKWQLESDAQQADRFAKEKEGRKEYRAEVKKSKTRQYKPKPLQTQASFKAAKIQEQSDALFKLNKSVQIDSLRNLGLTTDAIKRLKYEKDRVNKIIELSNK